MSRRAKRITLISALAAALVILLIAGGFVALNVMNGSRGPEAAVREYVTAIADGHADRATELADPGIPTGERDTVSEAMLASATERIKIDRISLSGDSKGSRDVGAEVPVLVEYHLGGVSHTRAITAQRIENEGLLERWRITTPLLAHDVIASTVTGPVQVGSHGLTLAEEDFASGSQYGYGGGSSTSSSGVFVQAITTYPAIYPVSGPENDYYTFEPASLTASADASGEAYIYGQSATGTHSAPDMATLTATPTDALQAKVDEVVRAKIDECAKSTKSSPEGCPFGTYANYPVTWTVTSYPTAKLVGPNAFALEGGTMSYSYTPTGAFTSGKPYTGTASVQDGYGTTSGGILFDGTDVEVKFAED